MLALTMLRRSWPASCRSSAITGAKSLNFSLTIGCAGLPKVRPAGRRMLALAIPTIAVERRRVCHELIRRRQLSVTMRTPSTAKFERQSANGDERNDTHAANGIPRLGYFDAPLAIRTLIRATCNNDRQSMHRTEPSGK